MKIKSVTSTVIFETVGYDSVKFDYIIDGEFANNLETEVNNKFFDNILYTHIIGSIWSL